MSPADRAESQQPAAATVQPAAFTQWLRRVRDLVWRLVVTTVGSCMRYRVTGLAAEAAFFAVLSVPPLIFAMAGMIGFVTDQFSPAQVENVRQAVIDLSSRALTDNAVEQIITKTIDDVRELVAGVRGRANVLQGGDLDGGIWTVGQSQALIHDVPTCKELVRNIMKQAEEIVSGRLDKMATGKEAASARVVVPEPAE